MSRNTKHIQKTITVYTDGSCISNPGPGGFAGLIIDSDCIIAEIKGSREDTTNNRMELTAIIEILKSLEEPTEVVVFSDSEYCVKGINERLENWFRNNWKGSNKKKVLNIDLWEEYLTVSKFHKVKAKWIRSHSGNEYNEMANDIAYQEALKIKDMLNEKN